MRVAPDTFPKLTNQSVIPIWCLHNNRLQSHREKTVCTQNALYPYVLFASVCKGQCRNSHHLTNYKLRK